MQHITANNDKMNLCPRCIFAIKFRQASTREPFEVHPLHAGDGRYGPQIAVLPYPVPVHAGGADKQIAHGSNRPFTFQSLSSAMRTLTRVPVASWDSSRMLPAARRACMASYFS